MIFFVVFDVLAVASLCFLVCAFWANTPKMLVVSVGLMIAAALTAVAGTASDERFWTLACLSGAFALMGISHAIPFRQLEESEKEDEKEEGEKEGKKEEKSEEEEKTPEEK